MAYVPDALNADLENAISEVRKAVLSGHSVINAGPTTVRRRTLISRNSSEKSGLGRL